MYEVVRNMQKKKKGCANIKEKENEIVYWASWLLRSAFMAALSFMRRTEQVQKMLTKHHGACISVYCLFCMHVTQNILQISYEISGLVTLMSNGQDRNHRKARISRGTKGPFIVWLFWTRPRNFPEFLPFERGGSAYCWSCTAPCWRSTEYSQTTTSWLILWPNRILFLWSFYLKGLSHSDRNVLLQSNTFSTGSKAGW